MKFRTSYLVVPIVILSVAFVGGSIPITEWYDSLTLPPYTPSGEWIAAIWFTLYALMTVAFILTWNALEHTFKFLSFFWMFIISSLLNAAWTVLFFSKQLIFAAFIDAALLALSVLVLIAMSWKPSRIAAYLLIPYFLWTTFATILNFHIWILNPLP